MYKEFWKKLLLLIMKYDIDTPLVLFLDNLTSHLSNKSEHLDELEKVSFLRSYSIHSLL